MDMQRENPFEEIYKTTNAGGSRKKYANLPEFPRIIDIEVTNLCNFNCLFCPTGTLSQKRDTGFMDKQVFNEIISEVSVHRTPLRFIRWGEPTLHSEFIDYLRIAKNNGIMCHVTTNGSKLDDALIMTLVELGVESLKFSFQGVDRDSYQEMRNTDFFDDLLDIVQRFNEIRGDRLYPFLQISTTTTYESDEQISVFKKKVEPMVDKLIVGKTNLDRVSVESIRLKEKHKKTLKRLQSQQSVNKQHPECPEVFDKLSINWDGTVSACCGDSDNLMLIGDLSKQTLKEVWNSDVMDRYRMILAEMRHDELPLCKTCYDVHDIVKKV
jgi:MoaA/NifB/PqqE/SkfB family radical SAM enzyme